MTTVEVDITELDAFAADLSAAGAALLGNIKPAVQRGALNIKRQMQAEMAESASFKGAAAAITYTTTTTTGAVTAEIGPQSGPGQPGALANIAYFGGAQGGGTVPDPMGALEAEAPRFESAVRDVLAGLL